MRTLTLALPLIALLVALTHGQFRWGEAYDAGVDPRTARIMAKYKRVSVLRAGPRQQLLPQKNLPLRLATHP